MALIVRLCERVKALRPDRVCFVDNCYGELLQDGEPTAVGAYLKPVSAPMPDYGSELIMGGGTFIDGSTSEFSADAPLREPCVLYAQGGGDDGLESEPSPSEGTRFGINAKAAGG